MASMDLKVVCRADEGRGLAPSSISLNERIRNHNFLMLPRLHHRFGAGEMRIDAITDRPVRG